MVEAAASAWDHSRINMRRLFAPAFAAACGLSATATEFEQVPGLTGTLIVTNKTPSTATIIDVASGTALATLPTGNNPHEIVLSADGRTAVVTDYGTGTAPTLTVIDVPGKRVARTISLGQYTAPHGIVYIPGDSLVAVTSERTNHVVIVHVASGAIRKAIPTNNPGSHMVAITGDGRRAWTGDMGSHTVTELDVVAGTYLRSISVPNTPEAINVTPDGREVWVGSNQTGKVSVVDPTTGSVTTAAEGVSWPYRVLFSPDGKTVVLPDMRNHDVRFLDRATRRELSRISVPGAGPQGVIMTPDGRYLLESLSTQARVMVVDMRTRQVVGHIPAGQTPDGIAYTPNVLR
jgi:DNA-binding beta-propeller fold protein YncE